MQGLSFKAFERRIRGEFSTSPWGHGNCQNRPREFCIKATRLDSFGAVSEKGVGHTGGVGTC